MENQINSYLTTWQESIAGVLGQIAGEAVTARLIDEESASAYFEALEGQRLWLRASIGKRLKGGQAFLVPHGDGARLAKLLTGEDASADEELTSDRKEALEELLRQCAGAASSALKNKGGDVTIKLDGEGQLEGSPLLVGLRFAWGGGTVAMGLALDAALQESLKSDGREQAMAATAGGSPAAPVAASPAAAAAAQNRNLDLLMGVTLEVTLRFGERQLLLKDVLDLSPGSVVELDRQVQEPAELLVTGRVVARGEVVIVDGNYGLRVTEVASHSQRMEVFA